MTHTYASGDIGRTFDILVTATDGTGDHFSNDLIVASAFLTGEGLYRYAGSDGSFSQFFSGAELTNAYAVVIGPDGLLYAAGHGSDNVVRYNAATGAFVDTFVAAGSGGLDRAAGLAFGADGNLYVSSQFTDEVLKYDGTTGTFLGTFVTAGSGGVDAPTALQFRSDGYLYVSSYNTDAILRYDADTGAFVDTFVATASGGLNGPGDFAFGPDGNLYVSGTNSVIKRFDGSTGAFIDDFVAVGSGGLGESIGLEFGPDGNLYVSNFTQDEILVFDGSTGTLIGDYVSTGTGGLDGPTSLVFAPNHQVAVISPAPVLDLDANDSAASGLDFAASWTEGAGAVSIVDSDATLDDPDSSNLSSLTVTITNQLDGIAEVLAVNTSGTSITAIYNSGTGVLTLSGNDTVANYLTVLKSITYNNSSDAPATTARSITFVASDGVNTSQVATTTVTMTAVNDAPSGTDKTITINEDATYTLTAADFGFSDVDGNAFNRVWIMTLPGAGQLKFNGSTFAANNWILKSDIDLGLLTYEPDPDDNGTNYAGFDFQVQDNGGTANGGVNRDPSSNTITFNVTAQNDDPTADLGGPYTINEGDSLSLDASGSGDVDGDTLTYRWDLDNDGLYDDLVTNNATESVSWATLYGLGVDDDGSYTIRLQVDDGKGGLVSSSTTVTVNNVAPTLTATGTATAGGGATYTLTLTDTDPGNDSISSWIVNWGDGSIDTYVGDPASVTHVYSSILAGLTFDITVSAIDEDGQYFNATMLAPAYGGEYVSQFSGYSGTSLGSFAPSTDGISGHASIVLMPNGNYLVSGVDSGNILKYQPDGTLVGDFVAASDPDLNNPGGIAYGPDGHLYVADYGAGKIVRFNGTTGAWIDDFVASGLSSPLGLQFGPDGKLYVANRGSAGVLRYDGITGALDTGFVVGSISGAEDLTFGSDGNIYVGSTSGVMRVNSTTGAISTFIANGTGGLGLAAGLDFGPDGNLYVADQNNNVIRRYDGSTGAYIDDYAAGIVGPAYPDFTPDLRVTVTNSNQSPTIATNTGTTVLEGSTANIITTAMLNEGDPDDDGIELTWTITSNVGNGTLRLNGSAIGLNDTFTQQDIDDNLLTYDHNGGETTSDAFDFSLADGGENGSTPVTGSFSFTVTPVNDAPTGSVTIDNTTPAQGDTLTASNTLADADGLGAITYTWKADGATVGTGTTYTLTEAEVGTVITVEASYTDGHGTNEVVASSATAAVTNVTRGSGFPHDEAEKMLADIFYSNTSDAIVNGTRDVTLVTLTDDGGGTDTATVNTISTVTLVAVNDAPVMSSVEGTALPYMENDGPMAITSTLTLSDVDNLNLTSATVQITGNYLSTEDVLSFSDTAQITGSWDSGTGTLTLTGPATVAQFQAALRLVSYENTSENPDTSPRTVSYTVSDGALNSIR
ncbi:MAG: cadherin-like domain-containing protein [Planctomycetaceae bacterium]